MSMASTSGPALAVPVAAHAGVDTRGLPEKIAIRDKGSVIGDIKTAGISIDDGAYFKGSIDIVRPEPRHAKTTVLSEPAMASGD